MIDAFLSRPLDTEHVEEFATLMSDLGASAKMVGGNVYMELPDPEAVTKLHLACKKWGIEYNIIDSRHKSLHQLRVERSMRDKGMIIPDKNILAYEVVTMYETVLLAALNNIKQGIVLEESLCRISTATTVLKAALDIADEEVQPKYDAALDIADEEVQPKYDME